eukprot:9284715-Pyramimonas_sp.AAC.1
MQGGKKGEKRSNLLGAHHSFSVLAVGSRTVSVCRERRGGSPGTCCAHGWVTIPQEPGCLFPLFIKMNAINHAQIMKHIQTRAERTKYDQARAEKVEILPFFCLSSSFLYGDLLLLLLLSY